MIALSSTIRIHANTATVLWLFNISVALRTWEAAAHVVAALSALPVWAKVAIMLSKSLNGLKRGTNRFAPMALPEV
jgi:hypothetical protein